MATEEKQQYVNKIKEAKEAAFLVIEKYIDIGSFIIKKEAVICLKKLNYDYRLKYYEDGEKEEIDDIYPRVAKAIDECIATINNIAKDDVATIGVYLQKKLHGIIDILKERCIK